MDIQGFMSIFFVGIICFIPIIFWGYFFSFADSSIFNKKRFFFGIFAGMISTLPILSLGRIFEISSLSVLHIFENIASLGGIKSYFFSFFSFLFVLLLIVTIITVFSSILHRLKKRELSLFLKSFLGFFMTIGSILLLFFLLQVLAGIFPIIEVNSLNNAPIFSSTVFNSVKLVIFYYIIIAFLEESAKHFSFLGTNIPHDITIKQAILFTIFIALGFSFLENILYGVKVIEEYGLGMELPIIVLYRSIFSLFIHVFSSAILGYFFAKAYIKYRSENIEWGVIKELLSGIVLALLFHSSFDVLVTYNMNIFIFIYFIIGYFWVSKLVFYK